MRKRDSVFDFRFLILDLPSVPSCLRGFVPLFLCSVFFLAFAGCAPKEPPAQQKAYFGPTKTLPEVVEAINANNRRISTLWTRVTYEAWLKDSATKEEHHLYDEDATIQYRAPGEFRLRASKTGAGLILDLGINKERFWLISHQQDTMWWGHVTNADAGIDPRIPIPPQGMLEVMGISTLNTDLLAEPAPVLRFNNDAKVYMIIWTRRVGDRYVAVREAWYDMQTLLPAKVILFDRDGRAILRADLQRHKEIAAATEGKPGPRIATFYRIFLPENGSRMNLELTSTRFEREGMPNDSSFRFVKTIPVAKEIQVDAPK